jgi:hypothetical protein
LRLFLLNKTKKKTKKNCWEISKTKAKNARRNIPHACFCEFFFSSWRLKMTVGAYILVVGIVDSCGDHFLPFVVLSSSSSSSSSCVMLSSLFRDS